MKFEVGNLKLGIRNWVAPSFFLFITFFFTQNLYARQQYNNDSVLIKQIWISGNNLTSAHVILREISLKQGDYILRAALADRISESEKFLINTHIFLTDTITDTIIQNEAYLYIKVKERYYVEWWHAELKAADRDVNVWIRKPSLYRLTFGWLPVFGNLTGNNDRLTVSAVFGWRQIYALDYTFPYINKAKTIGLENIIYYQQGHEAGAFTENNQVTYLRVDQNYIYHKAGWQSTLIYRKKYQVSHKLTVGFDYYNIGDTLRNVNLDYLGNGRNIIRVPRLAYNFIYDMRDYTFYARKGDLINFSIEHDGLPVLLKDVNITTVDLTYRKFIPLGGRFYYQGGFTSEYDFQNTMPYVFRTATGLGYRDDVDGFENYVIDGRAYFVVDNELKFLALSRLVRLPQVPIPFTNHIFMRKNGPFNPAPVNVYLKVFIQQGADFYNPAVEAQNNNTLSNKFLNGTGAGFDFVTYYDSVLRVEYSFNNFGKGGLFFHFTEVF